MRYFNRNMQEKLRGQFSSFDNVLQKTFPEMTFKFDGLEIREGYEKWGAEKGEEYFVIKLSEEE